MKNIIYACIILHNMIVENEWHTYQNHIDYDSEGNDMSTNKIYSGAYPNFILTYLQRKANEIKIKARETTGTTKGT